MNFSSSILCACCVGSSNWTAVQNERDRISSRRPSYEEPISANGLTINVLINAETMSRQVKKKQQTNKFDTFLLCPYNQKETFKNSKLSSGIASICLWFFFFFFKSAFPFLIDLQQPYYFTNSLLTFAHFFPFPFLPFFLFSLSFSFTLPLAKWKNKKNLCICAAIFSSSLPRSTLSFLVWKFVFKSALSRQRLRFEQQKDGYHQRRLRIHEAAAALFGRMGKIHSCF